MPFYEDLSVFEYHDIDFNGQVLNVGWLSASKPFRTGGIDLRAKKVIQELVRYPINLFRGSHYCEFCPPPIKEKIEGVFDYKIIRDCPKGNGEIHVLGVKGVMYVAPTLIFHYIDAHNYMPPKEFLDAVILSYPDIHR